MMYLSPRCGRRSMLFSCAHLSNRKSIASRFTAHASIGIASDLDAVYVYLRVD